MMAKLTYRWTKQSISGLLVLATGLMACSSLGEDKKDSDSNSEELAREVEERSLKHLSQTISVLDASTRFVDDMSHVESFGQAMDALSTISVGLDSSIEEMVRKVGQELHGQSRLWMDIGPARRIGGRLVSRLQSANSAPNGDLRENISGSMASDSKIARREEGSETYAEIDGILQELLRDKVFHSDNIESSIGNEVTYLMQGKTMCEYDEVAWDCEEDGQDCSERTSESGKTSIDEECVKMIDALQVRVIATIIEDDGLNLSLRVGEKQIEPLALVLSSERYVFQMDIGTMIETYALAADAVEEEIELPEHAKGKIQSTFEILGEDAMATSFSIIDAIDFAFVTDEGPWRIQAATSDPMSLLALDAQLESILGAINMGAVDLSFPETTLTTQSSGNQIDVHIAGASATTQLSSQDEFFEIRNLSLGQATSWMKRGGAPVVSIDVNEDLGRSFGIIVEPDSSGQSANISIDPALFIVADFLLEDFAPEIGWPENWVDDRYEVIFDGETTPMIYPYVSDVTNEAAIAIRNGSMLVRIADGRQVLVESGQCLIRDEVIESTEHPFLGSLRTGTCP